MKKLAVDRPFDADLWAEAGQIARQYALVITTEPDVGYFGRTIEFPFVMADGETVAQCAAETLEATTLAVATMLEDNQRPPAPASEGKRDQQVNIRLTAEEKLRLEEAARRDGFRGLSDYLRTAAIERAG